VTLNCSLNNTIECGHVVGCCEVDNEPSCLIEDVEFCDRGFAAPEGFCSNELVAINKLILLSEI
jgi:hypothetical protein